MLTRHNGLFTNVLRSGSGSWLELANYSFIYEIAF